MAAEGRRTKCDPATASAEYIQTFCEPCKTDGRTVTARKFCQSCREYLCQDCCQHHRKLKALKNHVLVDSEFATPTRMTHAKQPTISCSKHFDSLVLFYCPVHNISVCGTCATLEHKKCKVYHIPDISADYKDTEEYATLRHQLGTLENNTLSFLQNVEKIIRDSMGNGEMLLDDLRKFRIEIKNYLQKKEKELGSSFNKTLDEDLESLGQDRAACETIKLEIEEMKHKLVSSEDNGADLFIFSKQTLPRIITLHDMLHSNKKKKRLFSYNFKKRQECLDLLCTESPLGVIERRVDLQDSSTKYSTVHESAGNPKARVSWAKCRISGPKAINVQSPQDSGESNITGVTLSDSNSLLLTDFDNACVKRVDCRIGIICSYLPLSSGPWDVTKLSPDEAAITLPVMQQIQILSTKDELAVKRTFATKGECHGIDATVDVLVISFLEPGKVQVLDHFGKVLQTFIADHYGNTLFQWPYYVILTSDNDRKLMYVSDIVNKTVTKLSLEGDVLITYKDQDLDSPLGLAAPDTGHLLVCDSGSENIQLWSSRGKRVRTLLDKVGGVKCPQSVFYNSENSLLYTSFSRSNMLEVYSMK